MRLMKNFRFIKYMIAYVIGLTISWLIYGQLIAPMLMQGDLLGDFIVRLGYVAIPLTLAWFTIDAFERGEK